MFDFCPLLGVTPLVSTLQGLCQDHSASQIKTVELVWAARDKALIDQLCPVLDTFLRAAPKSIVFRVRAHLTSQDESSKILSTTTTTQTGATEQLGCVAPFVASSFSVQGSSLERRVMVGLCYFVACLGSSVLGLLFYKSIQIKSSITTNLLTLGAVSGGCFLWCLPCIHLLRYLQSRECTAHQLVQDTCVPSSDLEEFESMNPIQTQHDSEEFAIESIVERMNGRPDLELLFGSRCGEDVGVWVCGPEALKSAVRDCVEFQSQGLPKCGGRIRSRVSVFEETFEW